MAEYINPKNFAVVGYMRQPGYNIPRVATPHLTLLDDHTTPLCGMGKPGERSGANRSDAWVKPICANCIEIAAQRGLEEQPPLKLKPQDCPVRSEREGKRRPHNWISRRPRCKGCPPIERYKPTERCERKHPTYAWCNVCDAKDENRHYCDQWVGRTMGIATDFGPCDLTAKVFEQYDHWQKKHWGWLCHLHSAEGEKKRSDKYAAERAAEQVIQDARDKRAEDRRDAIDILKEMAMWMFENRELVAEDEWLGRIAERVARNDYVQDMLGKD